LTAGTYNLNLRAAQRGSGNASFQQIKASLQSTVPVVTGTKQFIWNGSSIVEERDANNVVTRRFYPQGEQISGASYYYTRDHLGSVRELTDTTGTIRARYDYDPYGYRTKVSGDLDASFGYTGHYFHQASGLNLARYRAYDASVGRWINRDPGDNPEMSQGPNLYLYVDNDPVNSIDVFGLAGVQPNAAQQAQINNALMAMHSLTGVHSDQPILSKSRK
jgi:RHS repeat-associated protein